MSAWYGNPTARSKPKLARLVQCAMKVIGMKEPQSLQSTYEQCVSRQAWGILSDTTQVLHAEFELLPSAEGIKHPIGNLNASNTNLCQLMNGAK